MLKRQIKKYILLFSTFVFGACVTAEEMREMIGPVRPVPTVDLNKYLGTWYEIAAIPQFFQKDCVANTRAEYSAGEGGLIKVVNSCDTASGERKVAEGRAKVVNQTTQSQLKVTFVKLWNWIFTLGGDYWILDLGPQYSYSVVGEGSRKYAWILSRTPKMEMDSLREAESHLRLQGYDTCKLLTSLQTQGGFSKRIPLCEMVRI